MNYHQIIEKEELRFLRTKVDSFVVGLMLEQYLINGIELKDMNFGKYLISHGIECVYDGTFGYFDIDSARKNKENE